MMAMMANFKFRPVFLDSISKLLFEKKRAPLSYFISVKPMCCYRERGKTSKEL
jgi:hypothetical protein